MLDIPNIRGVQPIDRKMVESLLILGFGLRRASRKYWGLQRDCIDNTAYYHYVNGEIANAIRWKIFQDLVDGLPVTATTGCPLKPGWSHPYWQTLRGG